jgi:hypothetical protein
MKLIIALILLFLVAFSLPAAELLSTGAFIYRNLTPANLTAEKGVEIWFGDDLRYSTGSAPAWSNAGENFDPNQGTYECWLRPNWDGDDGLSHYMIDTYVAWNDNRVLLYKSNTNEITGHLVDSDGTNHYLTSSVSGWVADTWYHVVMTWSLLNDSMIVYVDGSVVDNTPNPALSSDTIDALPTIIRIGRYLYPPASVLNGVIRGRILRRPLSATEISVLYNSGSGHLDSTVVDPDVVWMGDFTSE